jgi:hypothetical protein
MILRPGASGNRVHLFVDASYGVHADGDHTLGAAWSSAALAQYTAGRPSSRS